MKLVCSGEKQPQMQTSSEEFPFLSYSGIKNLIVLEGTLFIAIFLHSPPIIYIPTFPLYSSPLQHYALFYNEFYYYGVVKGKSFITINFVKSFVVLLKSFIVNALNVIRTRQYRLPQTNGWPDICLLSIVFFVQRSTILTVQWVAKEVH